MRPSFKLSEINLDDVNDRLSYKEVEIGEETRRAISKFSSEQQRKFELGAVSFLVASTKHLVKRLPLGNVILRSVRVLKPGARKESWTLKGIKILGRRLNTREDIDRLADEWRVYQQETIDEDWYMDSDVDPPKHVRVDHYWRKVEGIKNGMGEKKFPTIMNVIKTAIVLGHGNAEVERGFSESGKSVTNDRVRLSESSINGIRATSDGLKAFNGPGSVPITSQLLKLGRSAHAHYVMRLE